MPILYCVRERLKKMIFTAHTQEEMLRQLLTPKREGELVNPHVSIQKATTGIDFSDISRCLMPTSKSSHKPVSRDRK